MSVCCECCVLSGRGLCDGLIARPEESYRLWCVAVCDLYIYIYIHTHTHIKGHSRLVDITAGGDFLGLCDQKS